MTGSDTFPPKTIPDKTFAGLPSASAGELDRVVVALLGADHGSPYKPGEVSHAAGGAAAIRKGSQLFAGQLNQFDFDIGAVLRASSDDRSLVDCGDLKLHPADAAGNLAAIEASVRSILTAGAVPVVLGGDDSVPIPVFAAYEGRGPITMVQVDAHVDWGDEIQGNRWGYGSPMRRAAEMPWFTSMVQVGIRGLGSGTSDQHDDARAWGSRIFTMEDLGSGVDAALAAVPAGGDCFLSIDLDGLDPTVMPAVNMPTPGGLSYRDVLALVRGVAHRRRIAGAAVVEFVPARDPHGAAAVTASRLVLTLMGLIAAQARREEGDSGST